MRTDIGKFGLFALALGLALGLVSQSVYAENGTAAKKTVLPTEHLRSLHKQMTAGRTLATRDLRALADASDGLAAFKYGKWLEEQGQPGLMPDATHYYAIASYTDRDFAVRRLVALLNDPTLKLSTARKNEALDAMVRQAKTGNADAALALSNMYAAGIPFGKDPKAVRNWLEVAAKSGRGDAAVKLALVYLMPTDGTAPDEEGARRALDIALKQPDPGTKSMAQTLLARLDLTAPRLKVATLRPLPRPLREGVTP